VRWCLRSSSVRGGYQAHAEGHGRFHTVGQALQMCSVAQARTAQPDPGALVREALRHSQGALALGRALPLGVGVVIGAVGNVATARAVIRSTERAFGPPSVNRWPDSLAPRAVQESDRRPLVRPVPPDRSPTRQVRGGTPSFPRSATVDASIDRMRILG